MTPPVLLAVLAHPDDESFGMGGTLALYARKGWDVYLACATNGEAGDVEPQKMKGFASVKELRMGELRCAAAQLGLKQVFFLGYRDSGMAGSPDNQDPAAQVNHPVDEVAGKVVKLIRDLKADYVLTHDPIGGYRHPDHIHIHRATLLAFEKAGDASFHPEAGAPHQPRMLFYHLFPRGLLRFAVNLMPLFGVNPRKLGRNGDIDMKAVVEVDYPAHVKINITPVAAVKTAASTCHASQGGTGMRQGLLGLIYKLFGESELFMQAYPPLADGWKLRRDLAA